VLVFLHIFYNKSQRAVDPEKMLYAFCKVPKNEIAKIDDLAMSPSTKFKL